MTFLKLRSWHLLAKVTAAGWETRCGRTVNQDARVSDALPSNEKSCEVCLRLNAADEARLAVANDEVPG